MILSSNILPKLKDVGLLNVELFRNNEIRLTCPFHYTQYDNGTHSKTAFLIGEKNLFYCFSCHKTLPLAAFQSETGVALGLEIEDEDLDFSFVMNDYDQISAKNHRKFEIGQRVFSEAGDFRLYPKVVNFFKKRLGDDFSLPPYLKVKYHEERNTVLFKAYSEAILERFPSGSMTRFKLYELEPSMMYFSPKPTDYRIVTEGLFDALKTFQLDKNVVTLMTNTISPLKINQLETLVSPGGTIYSLLDNDDAGRIGTEDLRAGALSIGRRFVEINIGEQLKILGYKPDLFKDPGEIPYNILSQMINNGKNFCEAAVRFSYSEIF